ncbi:DNA-directed RNA polymerase I subunit RPA12 like protein [Argiope bruennichi]|uniref:DNA-directed RNA polymerase subunit n=2 Tax=Argiope bruennichi TaxID=94029 RepID=A0A8T0EXS0_ARGBR|nr:DNA-directed RNA polymerase I subunit RPA12 like protein [Argiope bruennichi]
MASLHSSFQTDADFCPECGTILPLPGSERTVTCLACEFKVDVKTFDHLSTDYEIKFNNRSKFKKLKEKDNRKGADGPLAADRECSKCGHQGMTYSTLQTRSADEGQTVFFSCPNCKHQELEN